MFLTRLDFHLFYDPIDLPCWAIQLILWSKQCPLGAPTFLALLGSNPQLQDVCEILRFCLTELCACGEIRCLPIPCPYLYTLSATSSDASYLLAVRRVRIGWTLVFYWQRIFVPYQAMIATTSAIESWPVHKTLTWQAYLPSNCNADDHFFAIAPSTTEGYRASDYTNERVMIPHYCSGLGYAALLSLVLSLPTSCLFPLRAVWRLHEDIAWREASHQ